MVPTNPLQPRIGGGLIERKVCVPVKSISFFVAAALFEIAGCFSFWAWLRNAQSPWIVVPGVASLILFALCLTRVEAAYAGRAYAAYGGIYIVSSLAWLRGAAVWRGLPRIAGM